MKSVTVLLAIACVLLVGCVTRENNESATAVESGRTLQFRVVDSESGTGLENVRARVIDRESVSDSGDYTVTRAVGVTDSAGWIAIKRVSAGDMLYFEAEQHLSAVAGLCEPDHYISYATVPPPASPNLRPGQTTVRINDVIEIPLLRKQHE